MAEYKDLYSELALAMRALRPAVVKLAPTEQNMDEGSILHRMEHWGYYLLPKSHPRSPGYTGLLVAIGETPTREHYDPESIHLRIAEADNDVYWANYSLKVHSVKSKLVVPGQVSLRDRIDKRVEFFTFGGSLEVVSRTREAVLSLRSPAPILDLNGPPESVADQLAFETEAMIAEQEARWGLNEDGFLRRLGEVDPFEFYLAILQSILQSYEHSSALRMSFHHLYDALLREKKWLLEANQWPAMPQDLNQLFTPD